MPTANGLTVRVINNVVKKMDVKPRFYDAFRKDGYQGTFQFKQKVHRPLSSLSHIIVYHAEGWSFLHSHPFLSGSPSREVRFN